MQFALLLEAIFRNKPDWKWDFERDGQPWFRLQKAMYGHPLAGDFWGWEFRSMMELIGWRTHESDDEKTIYVHRGFGPNALVEGPDQDPICAVLVIYVDDGFLVSFDDEVTEQTRQLLDDQWNAREWNLWSAEKSERFLAGDHIYRGGEPSSRVTIAMDTYVELGCDKYVADGGKLLPTTPKTPMSTEEEARDEAQGVPAHRGRRGRRGGLLHPDPLLDAHDGGRADRQGARARSSSSSSSSSSRPIPRAMGRGRALPRLAREDR